MELSNAQKIVNIIHSVRDTHVNASQTPQWPRKLSSSVNTPQTSVNLGIVVGSGRALRTLLFLIHFDF